MLQALVLQVTSPVDWVWGRKLPCSSRGSLCRESRFAGFNGLAPVLAELYPEILNVNGRLASMCHEAKKMCARYKMTGQIFCRCRRQSAACVCRDDSDHAHHISSNFARNFTAGPQLQCHVQGLQAAASRALPRLAQRRSG